MKTRFLKSVTFCQSATFVVNVIHVVFLVVDKTDQTSLRLLYMCLRVYSKLCFLNKNKALTLQGGFLTLPSPPGEPRTDHM